MTSINMDRAMEATTAPYDSIILGQIGHIDHNPQYVRLENGRLLVEVTTLPDGEQVIATMDTAGGNNNGLYMPLNLGQRVVLAFPGGSGAQPIIIARLNDADAPFPTGSVQPTVPISAPLYGVMKTGAGQLMLIETGDDGDIIIHSGASVNIRTDDTGQVIVSGRTHIGQGAAPVTEPTGQSVGPMGTSIPGVAATPYIPVPATNAVVPPLEPVQAGSVPQPVPEDGIVRVKDPMQSNISIDPAAWAWLNGFIGVFNTWTPIAGTPATPGDSGTALKVALEGFLAANQIPESLTSLPAAGSLNTCSDT